VFHEASRVRQESVTDGGETPNRAATVRERGFAHPASPLSMPDDVTAEEAMPPLPAEHPTARWGGLPAPWEPMPDSIPAAPVLSLGNLQGNSSSTAVSSSTPSVLLAEQGRTITEESPAHPATTEARELEKHVPPDLDHLARQVYSLMKRRLAAERRRELLH
jgi:hypothetical protein